jgi:hypothetical protein
MAISEQYLVDEAGKRTAVLVPVEELERIQAALEDLKEKTDRAEWDDLMGAQAASLAAVWDNPEDEVWNDL